MQEKIYYPLSRETGATSRSRISQTFTVHHPRTSKEWHHASWYCIPKHWYISFGSPSPVGMELENEGMGVGSNNALPVAEIAVVERRDKQKKKRTN